MSFKGTYEVILGLKSTGDKKKNPSLTFPRINYVNPE